MYTDVIYTYECVKSRYLHMGYLHLLYTWNTQEPSAVQVLWEECLASEIRQPSFHRSLVFIE